MEKGEERWRNVKEKDMQREVKMETDNREIYRKEAKETQKRKIMKGRERWRKAKEKDIEREGKMEKGKRER